MTSSVTILRWVARFSGLLVAGGFLLLIAGEILSPHSGPPTNIREYTGIALVTATCAGMLLAWRWELPGAALSLASLIAFTALIHFTRHTVHVVMAIPGLLFLADYLVHRFHRATA